VTARIPLTGIKTLVRSGTVWTLTRYGTVDITEGWPGDFARGQLLVTSATGSSFRLARINPDTGGPDPVGQGRVRWPPASMVDYEPATGAILLFKDRDSRRDLWLTLAPAPGRPEGQP
jgi:hypothetical protein